MHATAPRSGSGRTPGASSRRRRGRFRGSRGRGRRSRSGSRPRPRPRAIGSARSRARPERAEPHPRARRTSRGRRSRSKHRQRSRTSHRARVAADPSPWSRQALRRASEDCPVSHSRRRMPARCRTSVRHRRPHARARPDGPSERGRKPAPNEVSAASSRRAPSRSCSSRLVGIVLLSVFAPSIVVGDTWLTLMAGREVVEHGLPAHRAPDRSSARAARGPTSSGSPRSSSTPPTGSQACAR